MRDRIKLAKDRFVDWPKVYDQVFDTYHNNGPSELTADIGLRQSIPFTTTIEKKENFRETLKPVIDKIRSYRDHVHYEESNGKFLTFISNRKRPDIQQFFLNLKNNEGAAEYAKNNELNYTIEI